MKIYLILFILGGFLSITCLIIEIAAVNSLQDTSEDYIYDIQKDSNSSSENFFKIVSSASIYITMAIGILTYTGFFNNIGGLCVLVTYTATWLGDVLKMGIAHPRPFWDDPRIDAMSCPKDFGAPSGHAVIVGTVIFYFFVQFFTKAKILSLIIALILLVLVGFDRNFMGVHFYFQVILGYAIAFWLVICFVTPRFWELLTSLNNRIFRLIFVEVFLFMCLGVGIAIYFGRDPEFKDKWKVNFNNKCNGSIDTETALFNSLSESTSIMIPAGFVIRYYFTLPKFNKNWKFWLCAYSIIIPFGIIEQICESYAAKLNKIGHFILFCILRFIAGFYISYITPFALSKCFKNRENSQMNNPNDLSENSMHHEVKL
ncbi:hypothetical protein SteCoe_37284 [Stentor coeruleus]|uniref:Phosphatidic acid phosphatase type 2/haloperoxidase domain-containing protein n=1 Tax=Stentor coeruleus TaxID=5963 RepID=A0A1R2AND3_9CILI|nr:hypothetical protein SteCoe_37284 [Stentor coeruleus]